VQNRAVELLNNLSQTVQTQTSGSKDLFVWASRSRNIVTIIIIIIVYYARRQPYTIKYTIKTLKLIKKATVCSKAYYVFKFFFFFWCTDVLTGQ